MGAEAEARAPSALADSFPRCYQSDYARDPAHVECTARSPTCYPNSGAYLATGVGLERWFEAQNDTLHSFLNTPMSNAECTHDQAVLHHMVLNRTAPRYTGLDMRLDDESAFFLNMHQCRPPQHWRFRNVSMCYHREHEPLAHARFECGSSPDCNASALWYAPGMTPPPRPIRKRGANRPWIAHANGKHDVLLQNPLFAPLLSGLAASKKLLAAYPVLLVDPAFGGVCVQSTIGQLSRIGQTGNQMKG
eukprot:3940505-Prymnesium_polylepis.1